MPRRFQFSSSDPCYRIVDQKVRDSGFFTSMQPLCDDGGERLVCASNGGDGGIGGVSYWISRQQGRWFIASWAPHYYAVPATADIADVVVASIRAATAHPNREYFDIDGEVKRSFGLLEITYEEFDAICGW
jgi:hypothetical protein